ncbi:hypothetical protein SAMN05216365_11312 [Porphyromonadaceae bacterium NLAE-zl-C104]|nr:hypothetical protein SAMN05216365_11312 [Porphyromonadaceae bacterium NLAE-zl-C104]
MRHCTLALIIGFSHLFLFLVSGQDKINIPDIYPLNNKIYKDGWIDFNKNGRIERALYLSVARFVCAAAARLGE